MLLRNAVLSLVEGFSGSTEPIPPERWAELDRVIAATVDDDWKLPSQTVSIDGEMSSQTVTIIPEAPSSFYQYGMVTIDGVDIKVRRRKRTLFWFDYL